MNPSDPLLAVAAGAFVQLTLDGQCEQRQAATALEKHSKHSDPQTNARQYNDDTPWSPRLTPGTEILSIVLYPTTIYAAAVRQGDISPRLVKDKGH